METGQITLIIALGLSLVTVRIISRGQLGMLHPLVVGTPP